MYNILLVDDNPDELERLEKIVKSSGEKCNIYKSMTLHESIKLIDSNDFEVVITDMELEDSESGLEVLKEAKEKNIYTQIIVITNHDTPNLQIEAMDLGAYIYIEKKSNTFVNDLINEFKEALSYRQSKLS